MSEIVSVEYLQTLLSKLVREAIPGEVKHLSSRRKQNEVRASGRIPQVAASEKGGAQTIFARRWGCKDRTLFCGSQSLH